MALFAKGMALLAILTLIDAVAPIDKIAWSYKLNPNSPVLMKPVKYLFQLSEGDVKSDSYNDGSWLSATSKSSEEYAKSVSQSFSVQAGYGPFAASAHESYQNMDGDSRNSMKSIRIWKFSKYRMSIQPDDLFPKLAKDDQNLLLTGDADRVRSELGEFYAKTAYFGGLFKSQYSRLMAEHEDEHSVSAEVKANYFSTGIKMGLGVQTKQNNNDMTTTFELSALAGDPTVLSTPANPTDDQVTQVQNAWAKTIHDDNLEMTEGILFPIWELLINYPDRMNKLKTDIEAAWDKERDNIPQPSGWGTRDCDKTYINKKWCNDYSVHPARRRRTPSFWVERTNHCPDGCYFDGGKKTDKVWCNDEGGFFACLQVPSRNVSTEMVV